MDRPRDKFPRRSMVHVGKFLIVKMNAFFKLVSMNSQCLRCASIGILHQIRSIYIYYMMEKCVKY